MGPSLDGFLGISYLTFRAVGMITEMRDVWDQNLVSGILAFLLLCRLFCGRSVSNASMKTLTIPDRDELLDMLEQSVMHIMLGFISLFSSYLGHPC